MIQRLSEVVTDGPLTAPRWLHHLVKVMTSASVFVALIAAGVPILAAGWCASVWLFVATRVKELLWPTDRAPRSFWDHLADALADGADACATLAVAYRLADGWTPALLILGACIAAWLAGNGDSRP